TCSMPAAASRSGAPAQKPPARAHRASAPAPCAMPCTRPWMATPQAEGNRRIIMLRRFALLPLLALLALLGACQSNNVTQDFDASRDFAAYRSWSWQEPALQYRPDDPRIKSD